MDNNNEGNSDKFFKDFNQRLNQFTIELKDAGNRLETDLQKKYEELKAAAKKIQDEASDKKNWQTMREGLNKDVKEMEDAFNSVFRKSGNG